ncbi:excalibur calcium-binding domain-containing protein [Sphingobium sp. CFD-2]|uniref:excalibur calcium-binding domain-containing protein n=1 Tax=Sphingobium sp. CFD-2 TaxID=2878542 RepID=UPI00214AC8BE|nr:excalibur calcium-binding domain-containing protein [Sphingobium sp. CFD-2]
MGGYLKLALFAALPISAASAHPGGLNAEGCHNNRKTGDYHCHRASAAPVRRQSLLAGARAFPNCSAARAAGAAPVRAGDPGYGRHLDRDGDGIGCE